MNNPVEFPEQNYVWRCGDIPNCQPLPAFQAWANDPNGASSTSCWQLDQASIDALVASGGRIWVTTFGQRPAPVYVSGVRPFDDDSIELARNFIAANGVQVLSMTEALVADEADRQRAAAPTVDTAFRPAAVDAAIERLGRQLIDFVAIDQAGGRDLSVRADEYPAKYVELLGVAALSFFTMHPELYVDSIVAQMVAFGEDDPLFIREGGSVLLDALSQYQNRADEDEGPIAGAVVSGPLANEVYDANERGLGDAQQQQQQQQQAPTWESIYRRQVYRDGDNQGNRGNLAVFALQLMRDWAAELGVAADAKECTGPHFDAMVGRLGETAVAFVAANADQDGLLAAVLRSYSDGDYVLQSMPGATDFWEAAKAIMYRAYMKPLSVVARTRKREAKALEYERQQLLAAILSDAESGNFERLKSIGVTQAWRDQPTTDDLGNTPLSFTWFFVDSARATGALNWTQAEAYIRKKFDEVRPPADVVTYDTNKGRRQCGADAASTCPADCTAASCQPTDDQKRQTLLAAGEAGLVGGDLVGVTASDAGDGQPLKLTPWRQSRAFAYLSDGGAPTDRQKDLGGRVIAQVWRQAKTLGLEPRAEDFAPDWLRMIGGAAEAWVKENPTKFLVDVVEALLTDNPPTPQTQAFVMLDGAVAWYIVQYAREAASNRRAASDEPSNTYPDAI